MQILVVLDVVLALLDERVQTRRRVSVIVAE